MAKKSDYSQYTCDRCGKLEYLPEGAVTVNRWYPVTRVTADAVEQSYLFDASCYQAYQSLMQTQDQAFNTYMKNEPAPTGSTTTEGE